MKNSRESKMEAFGRLLDIMDELREKCPWDREQTTESLRPLTIEECYELSDAIIREDSRELSKELGDVLLHIVFYAKIGEEQGNFDVKDVIDRLIDKLVYRHPHVFDTQQVESAGQVIKNWEDLKRKEKDGNKTILSGVPASLPSIVKAYRMQDKARAVGFDWDDKSQVWDKIKEEMAEFEKEIAGMNLTDEAVRLRAEQELGDLQFSLINMARLYDLNPDTALEMTNKKFKYRFTYLEMKAKEMGRSLKEMSLVEMDEIWNEAKKAE